MTVARRKQAADDDLRWSSPAGSGLRQEVSGSRLQIWLDRDELIRERRITTAGAAREQLRIGLHPAKSDSPTFAAVKEDCLGDAHPKCLRFQPNGSQLRHGEVSAKVDLGSLDGESEAATPSKMVETEVTSAVLGRDFRC